MTAFSFGDVAKQLKENTWQCWCDLLVRDTENMEYLDLLSSGGLQIPLWALTDRVCLWFSVIEEVNSNYYLQNTGSQQEHQQYVSSQMCLSFQMSCSSHSTGAPSVANRICYNIFLSTTREKEISCCIWRRINFFKRSMRNL